MRRIPEVLVTYSSIYDRVLTGYHAHEYTQEATVRGRAYASELQKAWDGPSVRILTAMAALSGVDWRRREVRAYVVSFVRYPFSEPLTLWMGEKGENVEGHITSLIHELAHTLLADNESALAEYWKSLEASHDGVDHTTIIHIPVQALVIETLKSVFEKTSARYIKHERWWENSKANSDMKNSYARSWSIVTSEGADSVLEKLRAHSNPIGLNP